MSNPTPILNNINAFDTTKGTTISFNIIGGTDIVRSNIVYIYDLSTNDLICTHLYISTESIHELPPNTDPSIVYADGKSSADFVNNKNYYLQIQTFTNTAGTAGGSGMSVAKTFWCLFNPALSVNTIPAAISTTSYNVGATYTTNVTDVTIPVTNIIQQYKFDLYTATGTLVQTSGNIIGSGEQEGTSTTYNITYNFSGLVVNNSYYVVVTTTSTEGMTVSAQSNTFTVSIDTPTVGGAIVNNNACDGYISVVSNLSDEYGGHVSGEMASFETDSVNNVSSLKVNMEPIQEGSGTPSPTNIRPIRGHSGVNAYVSPTQSADDGTKYSQEFDVSLTPTSTDKVPYTFKAVGRDVYGDRESDKIVGGTVAWNQLVAQRTSSYTKNGVTSTFDADGTVTLSGTITNSYAEVFNSITIVPNHIYTYGMVVIANPNNVRFNVKPLNIANNLEVIKANANQTYTNYGVSGVASGTDMTGIKFKANFFDLTQMFGTTIADYIYSLEQATAGAGAAWFRQYFPKDYYPYDPGTLRSVEGVSAHETVGFNQWDEEWEVGSINDSTGEDQASSTRIRSKGYIPVLPNTTYFFHCSHTTPYWNVYYYDSNKAFIGRKTVGKDSEFTTNSDVDYIRFRENEINYGTTYNHDICINLSDPTRNGEYEPYQKHTYPLDSSLTLRGVPKLDANNKLYYDGDTYESDGTVTRKYGIVDLGTLEWNYTSQAGVMLFYATLSGGSQNDDFDVICSKYPSAHSQASFLYADKVIRGYGSTSYNFSRIGARDESYTDAATFKAAMSGVYLVYELATPTTETAEPFTNPQVVDNWGTEAYVTTGIVPVGHDTTYLTRDIFSGTLDLVTGVLTVDRVLVTLDGSDHTFFSEVSTSQTAEGSLYVAFINNTINNIKYGGVCSSDKYEWINSSNASLHRGQFNSVGSYTRFCIADQSLNTLAKWDAWLAQNPLQLCYELATPQTYQLTRHQIQTLVGQNNVWSDAGDVDVTFNLPISNLLVKRQDASDVSGNWLTLYSQPITQASDMDFTFIDFLNQHGKTYRYALVPLLTQQQGDIDVEIEGGYTVSDDVLSVFDGVFIANNNGSQKLKAATEYGDLETNQDVGVLTTIGGKYPFVVSNSNLNYHSGSISALIVPSDFYTNGDLDRLSIVERREAIEKFLTDKTAKILKDWNGNIWLITFVENVEVSFVDDYGMGLGTLSAKWVEIGDVNDQTDLKQTGLI